MVDCYQRLGRIFYLQFQEGKRKQVGTGLPEYLFIYPFFNDSICAQRKAEDLAL
jgi:hypothetical protein